MKNKAKTYIELILIAGFVILADQWSKQLITKTLALGESFAPIPAIGNFFRIVHWRNTGVAFGLFQGSGWIFTIVGVGIVILIILFYKQVSDGPAAWRIALGLQLGGAIGNMIDRITRGYVVDFLWFGKFPVFNIADSAIVIGAAILIIYMWIDEKKAGSGQQTTVSEEKPQEEQHDERNKNSINL